MNASDGRGMDKATICRMFYCYYPKRGCVPQSCLGAFLDDHGWHCPAYEEATREEAREFAISWHAWASENLHMSMSEAALWGWYFEQLGEEFDLTDEFRENGII